MRRGATGGEGEPPHPSTSANGPWGAGTDKKLHPAFPAASPFVTAVGATQMEKVTEYLESPVCKAQQMQCAAKGTAKPRNPSHWTVWKAGELVVRDTLWRQDSVLDAPSLSLIHI